MQGLQSSFFFDRNVIVNVGRRTLEEARAHLIFLTAGGGEDYALSKAALTDGNTIDFLFGVRGSEVRSVASKANAVKKFMRSLDEHGQQAVTQFYLVVYQSLDRYHKSLDHPCSCFWSGSLQQNMLGDIEEAFECLQGLVTKKNVMREVD
jgi:hypothetical protein